MLINFPIVQPLSRQQLRKQILQRRNQLSYLEISNATTRITQKALEFVKYHQAEHVALYYAIKNEVQTHLLIEKLWERNITVYLPVIRIEQQDLIFLPYMKETLLFKNQFNIPEPRNKNETYKSKTTKDLDIIFVPLVAFDSHNERLGMGGGYYDRTLARYRELKTMLVGLAYSWQYVESLPTESWDIPLNYVITEED